MTTQLPQNIGADQAKRAAITRRRFLGGALAATASASTFTVLPSLSAEAPAEFKRKIKLGVVGNGGRGAWIANLFKQHGGYEMFAVADYFQGVADQCGDALGVDKARRFSTLSGYKKLIESGVEAVALETPPCFFPAHARAAVEAGLHVYVAKPVAVDVPGCLEIEAAAKLAAANRRCFLVDYQIPTDPHNREVMKQVHAGVIGPVAVVNSHYFAGLFSDPPFTANLESRLRHLTWCNDVAVGGGYHVNACIHAVDAALWVTGGRPVSATGVSRRMRENPHGDSHDTFSILYEFADGLVISHRGKHLNNQTGFDVVCQIQGQTGFAQTCYGGKASFKSREDGYNGQVENPYEAGAMRNIATFYQSVVEGNFENPTVRRAVDGALTTILGREAAARRTRLTMEELLKENKRLELDLKGLKA
ncbi:MAG: Gfo/Idh/MocA family oxidoreductase [Verrucomicrobia bacterium]|nr:Gfo/Idh/MocA family oxidoreductase [Verrucomicrobiota bacterium]